MRHRGTDEFTLVEVCKLGKVSMGSIYDKFETKDQLVLAVHQRMLAKVSSAQIEQLQKIARQSKNLNDLIPALIEVTAESLREFAPILRPMMLRSAADKTIELNGQDSYREVATLAIEQILSRREEISHPDPDQAAAAAYAMAYAVFARFLGLGSSEFHDNDLMDWLELKRNVSLMCLSFLKLSPELANLRL